MIRRSLRLGIRLGLLAGIALALFKLVQSRRSALEYGRPSSDWAPAPRPDDNLPRTPPEPELVQPAMLHEVLTKRPLERAAPAEDEPAPPPGSAARTEEAPPVESVVEEAPPVEPVVEAAPPVEPVVEKKATPAKRAAAKKAEAPAEPVKKATAKKAGAAKKAPAGKATAASDAPTAKKAAPAKKAATAKKAAKKQQP